MLVFILAGCVRSEVTQLTPDSALINARGSAFDSMGDVQKQMMLDAANTTIQSGYDFFLIVDSASGYKTDYMTTPGSYSGQSTYQGTLSGNSLYGTSNTYGTYTPPITTSFEKPRAAMQIQMFRGTPPTGEPGDHDARQVKSFLEAPGN